MCLFKKKPVKKSSKRNYRFSFVIRNIDMPNKNNRRYSEEAINGAFSKIDNAKDVVPVKYFGTSNTSYDIIGYCYIINNYPNIEGVGYIFDTKDNRKKVIHGYPCIVGTCDSSETASNGIETIEEFTIETIGIFSDTAHQCSFCLK